MGWTFVYQPVKGERAVLAVYPHTSNWDYPLGMCFKFASPVQVCYLIKDSWFHPLTGWFFKATGALAIDRSKHGNYVNSIAHLFENGDPLLIGIAPEGTRSYKPYLKSGFYYVALKAQVPIGLAFIDYKAKQVGVEHYFMPTGDVAQDLAYMRSYYQGKLGRIPTNMGGIDFKP